VDGYIVATINKKFLGFAGFLAASIALVMIGGIWFGTSWIPSPWFWLVVGSCLAASIVCFIVWRIDLAYAGVELEPGDLADEDESELKKGAPKPAPRPAAAAIAKAKHPMKVAGVIQKPVTKQPPSPASQPAVAQKEKVEAKAPAVEPKPSAKAVPFLPTTPAAKPAEPKKDDAKAAKLADQLSSISAKEPEADEQEDVVEEAETGPAKKVKLNRNNVQILIGVYREEGYHSVSFSKFRNELGVGKGRAILKLKRLLLEAVAMGFLAKKGSRYIIQREDQEPLE
jgi:hypothetical protein